MVTSAELDRLQRLNFVLQTLQEWVTPDAIARELGRDDPQDAALVSQRLRTTAGRDAALASMIALYKDVIEAHRQDGAYDPRLDLQAVALYLQALASTRSEALRSLCLTCALLRRIHRSSRWLPGLRGLMRLPAVERVVHAAHWNFRS
jgi:hypothetical protein